MNVFLSLPLPFWASFLTALGWLYCLWAISWHRLFHASMLQHTHRTELGYSFGRRIYWQMRYRTASLIAVCSLLPWLALLLGTDVLPRVVLSLATVILSLMWLMRPPGTLLSLMDRPGVTGWIVVANRNVVRAIVVFVLCGVIPALLIGAGVNLLVG